MEDDEVIIYDWLSPLRDLVDLIQKEEKDTDG